MARVLNPDDVRPLLQTLSDARWHSGARLAQDAGVTRAGLSKRIHRIMDLGLEVETRQGLGYRLAQPLDLLDTDTIVGALGERARSRVAVRVAFSTDSTNRQLLEADAAADPQALLAEHQTAGRGRRGRRWHSPFGANLYLSLAWTFPRWPAALTALPLVLGVAAARVLRDLGTVGIGLKWPNDLVSSGKKLGGILVEQRGEAGGACRTVQGIGLNVSMQRAPGVEQPWTRLCDVLGGAAPSRNHLAALLLDAWFVSLERFATDGFAPFVADWEAFDLTFRRAVTVHAADGETHGIAQGVDENGALKVRTAGNHVQRILSGDVSVRLDEPAPRAAAQ